ncbi:MAG: hypothetical protein AAF391_08050 [Bacteroidota bacterium]
MKILLKSMVWLAMFPFCGASAQSFTPENTDDITFTTVITPVCPHPIKVGIINDINSLCSSVQGLQRVEYSDIMQQFMEYTDGIGFGLIDGTVRSLQYLLTNDCSDIGRYERTRGFGAEHRIAERQRIFAKRERSWGSDPSMYEGHRVEIFYRELNMWNTPDVDMNELAQNMDQFLGQEVDQTITNAPIQATYMILMTNDEVLPISWWHDNSYIIVVNRMGDLPKCCTGVDIVVTTLDQAIQHIIDRENSQH